MAGASQPQKVQTVEVVEANVLDRMNETRELIAQRAYEANSKVVKAADDMYQQVNNLKQ